MKSVKQILALPSPPALKRSVAFLLLSLMCLSLLGSPESEGQTNLTSETSPGVVVEDVTHGSEAEKAGLVEGDVLLAWSRGDREGAIQSPFDVKEVETNQAPLGRVELQGLRGTQKRVWTLGQDSWRVRTRPNFVGDLLRDYLQAGELRNSGKPLEILEAAAHWKEMASRHSTSRSWVPAWLCFQAAESLSSAKQWKEANEAYQSATAHAAELAPFISAQLLQAWGTSYDQRSDWSNAEKYYQQAIAKIQTRDGEELAIARSLYALGMISFQRGDLDRAQSYQRQALEIREQLAPASMDMAASFNALGVLSLYRGDLARAEQYHHQALELREKLAPGSLAVADSLNNLGVLAKTRGDLVSAEQYQRQALEIREQLAPGSLDVARGLGNLGLVSLARGDLEGATQYFRKTLAIQEKWAPGSLGVAATLTNLGVVEQNRGDLGKAEEYHQKALAIRQKLAPGSLDVALCFNNLGIVAALQGDLDKAHQYQQQALDIRHKVAPGSQDEAASYDNLGSVAVLKGEPASANQYYQQALAIKEKVDPGSLDIAETFQGLGDAAYKSGNLVEAEEYYRQSLVIREKFIPGTTRHAEVLAGIASVLRDRQQPESASQFYAQALNALENQTGRLGGSEQLRSGFRASYSNIYKDYIDLLLTQHRTEAAFEVLEGSRARILLEMLRAAHIDVRKGADPKLLEQEHNLQTAIAAKSDRRLRLLSGDNNGQQLAALTKEIGDLEAQYQDIEERLHLNSPGYAALTQPRPLTLSQIQQLLDDHTVLLEYSLGERRSYVFAVTAQSLRVHELPERREIELQAKHLYQFLTVRNDSGKIEHADARRLRIAKADAAYLLAVSELSRVLLGPLRAELGRERLFIVSDGALRYVPFAALSAPSGSNSDLSPKTYAPLMVQHQIVELPSASVLAVLRNERNNRRPTPKEVMVLADPVFEANDVRVRRSTGEEQSAAAGSAERDVALSSKQGGVESAQRLTRSLADLALSRDAALRLPRLLFSRREAEAILGSVPAGAGTEALDFAANRKLVVSGKVDQYRIVHFATHALVDNDHPELSGLVLSLVDEHGKAQQGFLDLQDIYNLDLGADLVVLSACDTALGKQVDGEGMIGLTRGFMHAGAQAVIGSLWKVGDFATATFMKSFYEAMEQKRMSPAQALRHAQIALSKSKQLSSPYYWAGFTLQGEWK